MEGDVLWQIFAFSDSQHWRDLCLLDSSIYDNPVCAKWRNVIIYRNRPLTVATRELNIAELALWLREKYMVLNRGNIHEIFDENKDNAFYGLIDVLPLDMVHYVFRHVALKGDLEMLKWIHSKSKIPIFNVYYKPWIADTTHLDVLKWLVDTFYLSKDHVCVHNIKIFRENASKGNLEMLKWLTQKFQLSKKEATYMQNFAFRKAASRGDLEMLK